MRITDPANKPKWILGAKLKRALNAVIFSIVLLGTIVAAAIWSDGATPDKITQAAQMILQFDSFLAGGWIVGFFFFWGNFTTEFRELRKMAYRMKAYSVKELEEMREFLNVGKDELRIPAWIFVVLTGGIINFVASSFFAVGTVLSSPLVD